MKHWKKTLGGILTVGVLLMSTNSVMAANSIPVEECTMHEKRMLGFINEMELSALISSLPDETQSEILILAQTLQELMPPKNEIPDKVDDGEMQAICQQIEQIFADNGVSVTLRERKPSLPDKTGSHQEKNISIPSTNNTEENKPLHQNIEKNGAEINLHETIVSEMQQLPEEDQAKITDLFTQLEALRPERPTLTEEEKEAMTVKHTEIEAAQTALFNALKEAGIDLPVPVIPEQEDQK